MRGQVRQSSLDSAVAQCDRVTCQDFFASKTSQLNTVWFTSGLLRLSMCCADRVATCPSRVLVLGCSGVANKRIVSHTWPISLFRHLGFCGVMHLLSRRCLSLDPAVSRRSAGPEVAPRSAAPFGGSFAVLEIWENVETRASAQTTTFPDPNFSALQARSPDRGAQAQRTLRRRISG